MEKRINILIFIVIAFNLSALSQDFSYGYLVEFTEKTNTPFSIDQPNEFLSERAIARRQKFNIEITEQDLPVDPNYIEEVQKVEGIFHVSSKWMNSAVFYTNSKTFQDDVMALDFVSNVTLVFENLYQKKSAQQSKWIDDFDQSYYGEAYNQMEMLKAYELHHRGYLGNDIQIAVLDGGFWRVDELECFSYLWENNRILGTYDYISHDENVFDDHTHGMGVLSIMASNMPGELMGGAPEASYYLYRTENVFSEYPIEEENWIAAAEKADSAGADIITASLGYSTYDNPSMSHTYNDMDGQSTRITRGAEMAFTKGIFVVNSAGNEGNDEWYHITAPSDGEHVLCVGAVDSVQNIVFFSSRGPSFDQRIKPDVVAKGLQTALIHADGSVGTGSGTSYSCPVITGMVACLWEALPEYSNLELLDLMRSISDKYSNPDNNFGYGLPDFSKVSKILDINELELSGTDGLVNVYPNPFNQEFNLDLFAADQQPVTITVFNTQGQIVYSSTQVLQSGGYNQIKITDLDNLAKGYYLLNLETKHSSYTSKIVYQ